MPKLYEAVDDLLAVQQYLDDHADELLANGGELTPELVELIEAAQLRFEDKVVAVGMLAKREFADEEFLKAEIARLTQRKKTRENTVTGLKRYLLDQLTRAGRNVKTALLTVRTQRNPQPTFVAEPEAPAIIGPVIEDPTPDLAPFLTLVRPPTPAIHWAWNRDAILDAWKRWTAYDEAVAAHAAMVQAGDTDLPPLPEPPAVPRPPVGFVIEHRSHVRIG